MFKIAFYLLTIVIVGGCAVDGKHTYSNGKCITCWNDPITGEPINYKKGQEELSTEPKAAAITNPSATPKKESSSPQHSILGNLYFTRGEDLNPNNMVFYYQKYTKQPIPIEKIARSANRDIDNIFKSGNEFDKQRILLRFEKEFKAALSQVPSNHKISGDLNVKLGSYDFKRKAFPIRLNTIYRYKYGYYDVGFYPDEQQMEYLLRISPAIAEEIVNSNPERKVTLAYKGTIIRAARESRQLKSKPIKDALFYYELGGTGTPNTGVYNLLVLETKHLTYTYDKGNTYSVIPVTGSSQRQQSRDEQTREFFKQLKITR